jgi:hypothetical protein
VKTLPQFTDASVLSDDFETEETGLAVN